jgi:hypothetical protein
MSHALTAGISVKMLIHIAAGLIRRYVAKPTIVATKYIAAKLPTIRQNLPQNSTLFIGLYYEQLLQFVPSVSWTHVDPA